MHETDLIRQLSACFRRSPQQKNALFTSDAELVDIGGSLWGVTTDAFSPEEDCFGSDDPERIGHNVAVATLSDLLAAGCTPAFYLHSLDLPPEGESFGLSLSRGVAGVLDACGAFMLGGDLGCGPAWRCASTALGPLARPDPLTRLLPPRELALFVTGSLGDANAAAFQNAPPPAFELRLSASEALRRQASACIDTSDGLLNAVWQWLSVNPGHRFELDPGSIPYAPEALSAARQFNLPRSAFLLGGAGEYELMFAAPSSADVPDATRIGTVGPAAPGGVFFGSRRIPAAPPEPRCFPGRAFYVEALIAALEPYSELSHAP